MKLHEKKFTIKVKLNNELKDKLKYNLIKI